MRILVMDGYTRASLAITRALGQDGFHVVVGASAHPSLASASRFCGEKFIYPDPEINHEGFASALLRGVETGRFDVILPVTDVTTAAVTEDKERLGKNCTIPVPDHDTVLRASNKYTLMQLAESLSIPIPRTIYLDEQDSPEKAVEGSKSIGYPVVIKPSRSRYRTDCGWRKTGVGYARNEEELRTALEEASRNGSFPLLIQERIHGEGIGLFLCMNAGEVVASFSHKRLREKPPSGGVSVLRMSIPANPVLKTHSERLLRALNWFGVAMVEFKRDVKSGDYKLMEINGRFWGSLQLAIDAGVNFPSILARIALGEKVQPANDYRIGVKTRWLWGDIDVLLALMLKSRKKLNLPPEYPGRLRSLIDFMHFWGQDLHYEVFNRHDMGPWLFETRSRLLGRFS